MIRSLAPPDTLGGGVVLDPLRAAPRAVARAARAAGRLERGEPEPEARRRPSRARAAQPRARAARPRWRSSSRQRLKDGRPRAAAGRRAGPGACSRRCATHGRARAARTDDARARRRARTRSTHRLVAAIERDGQITLAAPTRRAQDLAQVRPGLPGALRRRQRSRCAGATRGSCAAGAERGLPERDLVFAQRGRGTPPACGRDRRRPRRPPTAAPRRLRGELGRRVLVDPLAVAVRRCREPGEPACAPRSPRSSTCTAGARRPAPAKSPSARRSEQEVAVRRRRRRRALGLELRDAPARGELAVQRHLGLQNGRGQPGEAPHP